VPYLAFITDPDLRAGLESGLQRVEARLAEAVKSSYPFVTETSTHLVDAGGKRFRPLMALLCAGFGDADQDDVYSAATVVELTHLATLYHDDVMDEAPLRRGRASANSRWDNSVAILTGDFLFSRASDILADLGPEAVRIQAKTFERLVTGQIKETVGPLDGEDPVDHHLQVLADKTGSLIATSAQFGAMFAGCDEAVVNTVTRYGERIGVAFQLADDIVDLTSESAASGKTPGTDLKEGVPTLTTLLAQREDGDGRIGALLGRPLSDAEVAEALDLLRGHAALEQARVVARQWADDARACLEPLPDGPPRRALASVCDYVVNRTG
jgi:heptaprenyl diphosphate synthase